MTREQPNSTLSPNPTLFRSFELPGGPQKNPPPPHQVSCETRPRRSRPTICWADRKIQHLNLSPVSRSWQEHSPVVLLILMTTPLRGLAIATGGLNSLPPLPGFSLLQLVSRFAINCAIA